MMATNKAPQPTPKSGAAGLKRYGFKIAALQSTPMEYILYAC